jgi:hypothetical protein
MQENYTELRNGSEATMEQRISVSLDGWMRTAEQGHIYGDGEPFADIHHIAVVLMALYRSIHNTRIERLWRDYTRGVGMKWKAFFMDLEFLDGLLPDLPAHIWLLHWLFLEAINEDLQEWKDAWNHHRLSLPGEPDRSPRDIFLFSIMQDGFRGIDPSTPDHELDEDVQADEVADQEVPENVVDAAENVENPFLPERIPASMSEVVCEVSGSLFTENFVNQLRVRLNNEVDASSRDMTIRRLVWQTALRICQTLPVQNGQYRCVDSFYPFK